VIAEFAHHHPELHGSAEIVAIFVVKIERIQSRDRFFQSLKILVQNALRTHALLFHQSGDVFPVSVV